MATCIGAKHLPGARRSYLRLGTRPETASAAVVNFWLIRIICT